MGRKLIIDGQIFQTPAWSRGMGKYSIELVAQLCQPALDTAWDSIEILLSAQLPSPPEVMAELRNKTKGIITSLDLQPNANDNAAIISHNRHIVDNHIGSDESVDYLILSLMQGEIYPVFPSSPASRKLLLFYDLIPLMLPNAYLNDPPTRKKYLTKFAELLRADTYLAISKTAANDLTTQLGIDTSRVTSIDGGPIEHAVTSKKIDTPKPFILMPTGNDLRKNNERGIQAFNKFNQEQSNKYSLVVTSFFDENEERRLRELSDKTVFTGNISGEELNYLYAEAEGLFFPSEYEGLGLPILEAVEKNKPVACSDISVFREIAETAFHYFNPRSVSDMAQALTDMVDSPRLNKADYSRIVETYTWANTADKLLKAVKHSAAAGKQKSKKVAVFGPDTSITPAGEHILLGHAELNRKCDIDYFLDAYSEQTEKRVNFLPYVTNTSITKPGLGFEASDYDAVYHVVGNGPGYASALFAALAVPGITILYDLHLDDTWGQMVEQNLVDPSRLVLEKQLDKDYGNKGEHLIVSLIAKQKVILVFTETAKTAVKTIVKKLGSDTKVQLIKHPVAAPVYKAISTTRSVQGSYVIYAESLLEAAEVEND
jgi:glycosyltransferase involved in cell wall biosynthesis